MLQGEPRLGIQISPPNGQIVVSDKGAGFLKLFLDGASILVGNPTAVFTGAKSLVDAANSLKFSDSPGKNAFTLILLGTAWTFDQIASDQDGSERDAGLASTVTKQACHLARVKPYFIEESFIANPASNDLYKDLKQIVLSNTLCLRDGFGVDQTQIDRRFDATFNRAVQEVFVQRPELLADVIRHFELTSRLPGTVDRDWRYYHSLLRFDFESAYLFGQESSKVSIAELYVPLRSYYKEANKQHSKLDFHVRDVYSDVSYLESHLIDWVRRAESSPILLLGGGPGSGKSTSLKSFVAKQEWLDDERVIFVPLQRINADADLKSEIDRIVRDKSNVFREFSPLSQDALDSCSTLILVFDGLDEIAKPGERADQITQQFILKLSIFLSNLQSRVRCPTIRCVLSGRVPAFQAAKRNLDLPADQCLELLGFSPTFAFDYDDAEGEEGPRGELAYLDQRLEWWEKYSAIFSNSEAPPEMFNDDRWNELLNEPLLCYLLGLSGYLRANVENELISVNQVFGILIDQIWSRGWGGTPGANRAGPGRSLTKDDFNALMEAFALAAWQGGDTRSANETLFKHTVFSIRRQDVWERFKQDNGEDVTNLALNFYLRSPEEAARGFEFTHKSFGDYLAARCLFKLALEAADYSYRKLDIALAEWFNASSNCKFTREIYDFLAGEMSLVLRTGDNVAAIKELNKKFEAICTSIAQDGFKIQHASDSMELYQQHRNAEIAAHAIRAASFHAIRQETGEACLFEKPEKAEINFSEIIRRLVEPESIIGSFSTGAFFPGLVATDEDFFGICLTGADLSWSKLTDCNFSWSHYQFTNFSNCDLEDSRFLRCNLMHCNFRHSNVNNVFFNWAQLDETDVFTDTTGTLHMNSATFALLSDDIFELCVSNKAVSARVDASEYGHNETRSQTLDRVVYFKDTFSSN